MCPTAAWRRTCKLCRTSASVLHIRPRHDTAQHCALKAEIEASGCEVSLTHDMKMTTGYMTSQYATDDKCICEDLMGVLTSFVLITVF